VLDKTAAGTKVVRGEAAFRLYDTYGLPRDFIEDMIEERKLAFDREGFETAMEQQREKARAKSKFKTDARGGEAFAGFDSVPATTFTGYDSTTAKTRVIALARLKDGAAPVEVQKLSSGDAGWIVLEETPFYVQSGGQISDVGTLRNDFGFVASVSDVELVCAGVRAHRARVHSGEIAIGAPVMAEIDAGRRAAIRRNHTATHLLHAALRQVLGPHVKQAGSLVAPDRLRFDFVHFSALTTEQLRNIEQIVNKHILRNTHVETVVKPTQEAIAAGAMALFGEKYGDKVRVVSVPGVSMELCGGTHVHATGDIGLFAIVSEGGVAAGTRRIEAITGTESLKLFEVNREIVHSLGQLVNARPEELAAKVNTLQDETKRLARELQQAKMKAAMGGGSGAQEDAIDVAGVKLIAREVSGLDKDALRALVDQHRDRIKSGVVVLAAPSDGKVSIVVGVTPDLTKKVPAGQVVKQLAPIVGGGGGGRPDFAEAGGKDPAKIGEMLAAARDVITKLLG
jgi:alanyl-tRNA synthetase